jgi:hypothetical protein
MNDCFTCGKELGMVSYRGKNGHYCSKECLLYIEPDHPLPHIEFEEDERWLGNQRRQRRIQG